MNYLHIVLVISTLASTLPEYFSTGQSAYAADRTHARPCDTLPKTHYRRPGTRLSPRCEQQASRGSTVGPSYALHTRSARDHSRSTASPIPTRPSAQRDIPPRATRA